MWQPAVNKCLFLAKINVVDVIIKRAGAGCTADKAEVMQRHRFAHAIAELYREHRERNADLVPRVLLTAVAVLFECVQSEA